MGIGPYSCKSCSRGRHLWDAIEKETIARNVDRLVLEAILRGMPQEMMATLPAKEVDKDAWNALKTMWLGVTCVCEAMATTLGK